MTDQELLFMAGKAVGLFIEFDANGNSYETKRKSGYLPFPWNPLLDDKDAIKLAMQLNISVLVDNDVESVGTSFMVGQYGHNTNEQWDEHGGDRMPAMRRAIVTAAAKIGGGSGDGN